MLKLTRSFQKKQVYRTYATVHNSLEQRTTAQLLAAKQAKGLTFEQIAQKLGRSEVWLAAVFYRQARCDETEEKNLMRILDIKSLEDPQDSLQNFPLKGAPVDVMDDPLIYRFNEITSIYGMPLKAIIHEKFGDGIMSAVDFTMHVSKVPNPAGDRVKIEMEGKFLAYKKW